jgi:hypothetical protein
VAEREGNLNLSQLLLHLDKGIFVAFGEYYVLMLNKACRFDSSAALT